MTGVAGGEVFRVRPGVVGSSGISRIGVEGSDCKSQGVPSVVELMILAVVSPMKNQLMKSIIWGTSQDTISMPVDSLDSSMANSIVNNRDSGEITLEIFSTKTRVDHPQGHNTKGLVSMIGQRSWKRL